MKDIGGTKMKFENEGELLKELGMESWRNLSKEKMIRFAAMMPDMDKEVALKIIQQLPEFTKFALEALNVMEKEHANTLSSNKDSQENVHKAYQDIRDILKGELKHENISSEEKKYILELIMETGKKEAEKDSENKQFLGGLFQSAAVGVGAVLLSAVVFVGGKFLLQNGKD